MEILKRKIKQKMTTGTTENCDSGCFVIKPDLNVDYNIKILLTTNEFNIGVYDNFDDLKSYYYYYYYDNDLSEPIGLNNIS